MLGVVKFFRRKYLDWENYKARIDFLDVFYFQQATRKESIRNL